MGRLVERELALSQLGETIAAALDGSGCLTILDGPAGVGKTALLDTSTRGLEGVTVLRANAQPLESPLAWGVARQLFEPVLETPAGERLSRGPARRAVAVLQDDAVAERDELELVHAFYRLTNELAATRPLLIVVDDLQWADRLSAMFLLYLSQRLRRTSVLATVRSGEPAEAEEAVRRLLAQAGESVISLTGLTPTGSAALVRERFPRATADFLTEADRVTAGNPLLLIELLAIVAATGGEADGAAARQLSSVTSVSLQRSTALRLAPTGRDGVRLAEAAAVLGPEAPLQRAAALAGLTVPAAAAAADALVRGGLLTSADPPAYAHPLVRSAVLGAIAEGELTLQHARAAALSRADGVRVEQVAGHHLLAAPMRSAEVVADLRAAAARALADAAPESACRYLRRALLEPPPPELRADVLGELAETELLAGLPEGLDHLNEAIGAGEPLHDQRLLVRLGDALFQSGQYAEASRVFDRALSHPGEADDALRARVRACRLAMETLQPGGDVEQDLLTVHEETADAALAVHLALASVMGVTSHQRTRSLLRAALNGRRSTETTVSLELLVALGCLVWSDLFDECDAIITESLVLADREAAHLGRAHLRFGRSWIRYWSGRLDEAATDALAAIEPWRGGWTGQVQFARFWAVMALVELDRVDEAAVLAHEPEPGAAGAEVVGVATIEVARARVATAQARPEAAARHAQRAAEAARVLPFLANPTVLPWRSEAALALLAVGDRPAAHQLSEEELTLARQYGAPRALGVALRAHGLVTGGDDGLALLREAVEVLGTSPAALELARARIDLGAALRRSGHPAKAREQLRVGLDAARLCGARLLEGRALDELRAAGGRLRRASTSGPGALTPAEQRVCELAARGLSNPEIAQQLFLSRRTVEFHLAGAFRKLGVRSRHELSTALAGQG